MLVLFLSLHFHTYLYFLWTIPWLGWRKKEDFSIVFVVQMETMLDCTFALFITIYRLYYLILQCSWLQLIDVLSCNYYVYLAQWRVHEFGIILLVIINFCWKLAWKKNCFAIIGKNGKVNEDSWLVICW